MKKCLEFDKLMCYLVIKRVGPALERAGYRPLFSDTINALEMKVGYES